MEVNLNCDLGEKSTHYSGKNDLNLLKIINSVNIACGYHAGNKEIIDKTIKSTYPFGKGEVVFDTVNEFRLVSPETTAGIALAIQKWTDDNLHYLFDDSASSKTGVTMTK